MPHAWTRAIGAACGSRARIFQGYAKWLIKQFNLANKAQKLLWQNHAVIKQVLHPRRQLHALKQKAIGNKGVQKLLSKLDAKAQSLQGELYQYKAKPGVGLLNQLFRLNVRTAFLSNEINVMSANAPTAQSYAEYEEPYQAMKVVLRRWQSPRGRICKP